MISRFSKIDKNKIVFVSGYFIFLHVGHIEYFRKARKLGDELIVILNNDEQQKLKYGRIIVPEMERMEVINALSDVGYCYLSIDKDRTVCKSLEHFYNQYVKNNSNNNEMIFANGGDRFSDNIPEFKLCNDLGIEMVFNVGHGGKVRSSSDLIKNYPKK